uniref:Uncharacterized protein n=1 Tax=Aegilops tauschii subsp. strangulata TaxID=200361 RepID=A0A453EQZ4_AEGTS
PIVASLTGESLLSIWEVHIDILLNIAQEFFRERVRVSPTERDTHHQTLRRTRATPTAAGSDRPRPRSGKIPHLPPPIPSPPPHGMDPVADAPDPPGSAATVLDTLGEEVLAVMSPVSICMALVVLLITLLAPPSSSPSAPPPVTAATLVYLESP